MKKYKLLLTILSLISLCGCSNSVDPYVVPNGGTVLDLSDAQNQTDLSNQVDEIVRNTLESMQESVSLTLSLDTLSGDFVSNTMTVNVDSASIKIKLDITDLAKELNTIKAKATVSNLNLVGTYSDSENGMNISANIENAGFYGYLIQGYPCVNLKNENLIKGLGDAYAQYLESKGEKSSGAEAFIRQLAGKYYFKDVFDEDFLGEKILTRDMVENIVDFRCGSTLVDILIDENYSNLFETTIYSDGGLAIKADATANELTTLLPDYTFAEDTSVKVILQADSSKRISSLGITGDIGIVLEDNFTINAEIATSLIFAYDISTPRVPKLTDFAPFPTYLLG